MRHRNNDRTFSVKLQHPQQAHGFKHLCDEHLQAALQLDEETADLWLDLAILRPAASGGGDGTEGTRDTVSACFICAFMKPLWHRGQRSLCSNLI